MAHKEKIILLFKIYNCDNICVSERRPLGLRASDSHSRVQQAAPPQWQELCTPHIDTNAQSLASKEKMPSSGNFPSLENRTIQKLILAQHVQARVCACLCLCACAGVAVLVLVVVLVRVRGGSCACACACACACVRVRVRKHVCMCVCVSIVNCVDVMCMH